jgi:hypothetical protein
MKYPNAIQLLRQYLGSLMILKRHNTKTKVNLNQRIQEIRRAISVLEREDN